MIPEPIITTIIQVKDGPSSVEFYRDRLGLSHKGANAEGQEMFALAGGALLALSPGPDATPTGRTEISFEVSNIESEIAELHGNGVEFADYDLPGLKTIDHIAVSGSMKAAWFEDPDGNVLCLHESL
ncbi:catechol 2,3-dioxygenase-like lactoylglutathione lyase family enzyme [Aeromicrobium panaciterrae]|uniref:Catechol 2,3-dioxygenase-like lactoylglutathione lyase family enzyme n=1 Tax=Aeromicrobium panaciterrae TaxID=363861 RepID=A0ABU1UJ63_9ACTN|nr:VOC family protein [Aeromicrobium panaciterrae]MDR7085227.1 catechol 2,3-dioxygenase-like lactoylglutathione lyase family enzyme [Aeromicrobium panaciterrae]